MAKTTKKNKPGAGPPEKPVKFEGSFDELMNIAIKPKVKKGK